MMRFQLRWILFVGVLCLGGCASKPAFEPDRISVVPTPEKSSYRREIAKNSISVGRIIVRDRDVALASPYRSALEDSLASFDLLSPSTEEAYFLIEANVLEYRVQDLKKAMRAMAFARIEYAVVEAATGKKVIQKTVAEQFTATPIKKSTGQFIAEAVGVAAIGVLTGTSPTYSEDIRYSDIPCTAKDAVEGDVAHAGVDKGELARCAAHHALHANLEGFFKQLLVY